MSGLSNTESAGEQGSVAPGERRTRYFGRDWPAFWRSLNTRQRLLRLDEQALRDIGLTRAEAEREARLPFWKL